MALVVDGAETDLAEFLPCRRLVDRSNRLNADRNLQAALELGHGLLLLDRELDLALLHSHRRAIPHVANVEANGRLQEFARFLVGAGARHPLELAKPNHGPVVEAPVRLSSRVVDELSKSICVCRSI